MDKMSLKIREVANLNGYYWDCIKKPLIEVKGFNECDIFINLI